MHKYFYGTGMTMHKAKVVLGIDTHFLIQLDSNSIKFHYDSDSFGYILDTMSILPLNILSKHLL